MDHLFKGDLKKNEHSTLVFTFVNASTPVAEWLMSVNLTNRTTGESGQKGRVLKGFLG